MDPSLPVLSEEDKCEAASSLETNVADAAQMKMY